MSAAAVVLASDAAATALTIVQGGYSDYLPLAVGDLLRRVLEHFRHLTGSGAPDHLQTEMMTHGEEARL